LKIWLFAAAIRGSDATGWLHQQEHLGATSFNNMLCALPMPREHRIDDLGRDMGFLISVLDVAYAAEGAGVACVLAESWTAPAPVAELSKHVACNSAKYEPGRFYRRELPLLRILIDGLDFLPSVFVVDGYVWLEAKNKPGLGAHLYESIGRAVPVVGVAKTPFRDDTWSAQVLRGKSRHPLFVTSAGLDQRRAAEFVLGMHGKHRIPTLLQRADHLARAAAR
jgi:deoxyribonuclease V